MSSLDSRTPCLIGVAQRAWRDEGDSPEPLSMWAEVSRAAAANADARGDVLARTSSVQVVNSLTWPYDDPPSRLADELAVTPTHTLYSGMGGTVPQVLAGRAAEAVARGDAEVVLIVGGEALATMRSARKEGRRLPWRHRSSGRPGFAVEDMPHPSEVAHGVLQAYLTFALLDVARRARVGSSPQRYRAELGRVLAPMTDVAARNPHAWFPIRRTAAEIITPTEANRMIAAPYTKYMTAVMDVDMAAALIVASSEAADDLGVPADKRVYLRGWGYAEDPGRLAARETLSGSPAMSHAAAAALGAAGVGIDEVAYLDLYSCFTSSVLFATDALGLTGDRDLTVTGGLPYAGGPASGYVLHAIASMTERLRADPGALGLTSGVGMHMAKHAFSVWSAEPGTFRPAPDPPAPTALPVVESYTGSAVVAAYSVVYDREGPWGAVMCDVPDGGRCYARVEDTDALAAIEADEWVGTTVEVVADGPVNRVKPGG